MYLKSFYLWIKINQVKEKPEVTCEKKGQKLLSNSDIHSSKALQSYTDISKFESVIDLEWDI